ncbi:MAG: C-GCAxxG-C-C family protein [Oscillospiraceae bacterium]
MRVGLLLWRRCGADAGDGGALSGAFWPWAAGCDGYEELGDDGEKAAHYARVQELAAAFRERHGAIQCRELLNHPDTGATPTPRTETFYRDRPCAKLVRDAAALLSAVYGVTIPGNGRLNKN